MVALFVSRLLVGIFSYYLVSPIFVWLGEAFSVATSNPLA